MLRSIRLMTIMPAVLPVLLTIGAAACPAAPPTGPKTTAVAVHGPKPRRVPPPSAGQIDESISRGIAFLLRTQNKNGSWGSARRTKDLNIYAPVPGAHHAFRAAVTSLCISALIETGGDDPEVEKALSRAEAWLLAELPKLRRATPTAIYNVWGHGYGIGALARMYNRRGDDAKRRRAIRAVIDGQIDLLTRYESVDGGWGYYDFHVGSKKPAASSTSFITAAVLVELDQARRIGVDVPEKLVDRAVASLRRQQKPDFSYLYGEYMKWRPMYPINRPGGSLGRSQACNVALRLWGDDRVTDEVIAVWLDRLFARNGWLDMGRKRPVPHESWFQVAAYFFYFGHYYAALAVEQLPEDQRPERQDQLARVLLHLQEKDGSWWDFPFYDYHQGYGTAFALMSLERCRRE